MSKRFAITTGDTDGIGFEVAAKALLKIKPSSQYQFVLWRGLQADPQLLQKIDRKWNRICVDDLSEAFKIKGPYLVDIASDKSPASWVEESAIACLQKKLAGLITGPLSKTLIRDAGLQDLGHTDILKRISKTKFSNMVFLGDKFHVALATGHLPIKDVPARLDLQTLQKSLLALNTLRLRLPATERRRPIGVLGLNPHAGEEGLIGTEELRIFKKLHSWAQTNNIPIEGPLVPDAAFQKPYWQKYSFYLALYHDQGLIPFKMAHGQESGVHLTLGIPFLRTSVDHGTAKDIFNKNRAHEGSMLEAIQWALKLSRPF